MEGIIKKQKDTYLVTVMDAVAVGDGTSKMLPAFLEENYQKQTEVALGAEAYDAESTEAMSGKAITTFLEENYQKQTEVALGAEEYNEESTEAMSGKALASAISTAFTQYNSGTAGQLPISNGDGTVTWTTIENAEEVGF